MAHLFQKEYSNKEIAAHIYKISGVATWLVKEFVGVAQVKETQFDSEIAAEKYAKELVADKKKTAKKEQESNSTDE
jgi:hypothetical protein